MRIASGRFLLVVATLATALASPASAETVVKIGAAISLTGPAAVYGVTQKAGIQAAV